jgi:hypothetical protein
MNENMPSELKNYLDEKESLLWTGKPKQGIKLKIIDVILIPFSLMFGGFVFFWEYKAITKEPSFFKIFGVLFILGSVYLIFGRFIYDAIKRKNIAYGITQSRIIIVSGIFMESVNSINIKNLKDIMLYENSNQSGTIVLGNENKLIGDFKRSGVNIRGFNHNTPALEMINEVKNVYNLILKLQKD